MKPSTLLSLLFALAFGIGYAAGYYRGQYLYEPDFIHRYTHTGIEVWDGREWVDIDLFDGWNDLEKADSITAAGIPRRPASIQ